MNVQNVSYDVLTVLQSKLEGLAAYDRYLQDCQEVGDDECRKLFEQLRQEDEQQVQRLRSEIKRLVLANSL